MSAKPFSETAGRFILWTRADYSGGWQPDNFETFEAAASAQKEKLKSGVYIDTIITETVPVVYVDGRLKGEKIS